jgi:cobalt-zinc-cadmium resistance protein CzcA
MPPSVADTFIMLKPESDWPKPARGREDFRKALQELVATVPGNNYEFTQPIEMRFNELISGVRSDLAIKVFGDDRDTMSRTADSIAAVLSGVAGAADVKVEQTTGLPMLTIRIDREKAARLGVSIADIQDLAATAIGGREAGTLFEGDRRFDIVVRLPEQLRSDLDAIGQLPLRVATRDKGQAAAFVRLADVAALDLAPGPNQVSRENGKRLVVVTANVSGRDIGSFVSDAGRRIAEQVKIPPGYWITWGGTFEQLQSATQRLLVVVPATLLIVFILLYAMFGNLRDGLLVFTGVPFAMTGGLLALTLRGIPMSISAAVGFIALCGVAVLNGMVMVSFIRGLREQGMPLEQAIDQGAMARLRPVLMTALVASLGFVPMAIATGTGAEVQRPLATVVIGGVLSSTLLTLLLLPLMYQIAHRKRGA